MAKRYFWLKLKEDFFNRPEIGILERGKRGREVLLFYLKILTLAIGTEGRLRISEAVPYDIPNLAAVTGNTIPLVKCAVERLKSLNLLFQEKDGTYYLPKVAEMQGSETNDAERMRKKRREQCSNNVQKRKSIEKEIEKESEIDLLSGGAATDQQVDLTDEQMAQLKELMGPGRAVTYVGKLEQFIRSRKATVKDPYQTILKWYREDCG